MHYGLGSHECAPYLHDGRSFQCGQRWPHAKPPCCLLHYHHIGPAEEIGAKYDATITRMCKENKKNHWGNLDPGHIHVKEKRANIVPNLTSTHTLMGSVRFGIPRELALVLKKRHGLVIFVETGTLVGHTSVWASDHFTTALTVDIEQKADYQTKGKSNILAFSMDSSVFSRNIVLWSPRTLLARRAHK